MLLFVAALFAALVLPVLFMDGMFVDGIYYASVSRNYAEGYGTFWNPYFSATVGEMHEQPPLMFALQALFFKTFGNTLYTERIYCAVAAILCSAVLLRSWKLLTGASTVNWLPLLLWAVMPVTFYAFTTNLEECTMTIFVLLAFNSILRALNSPPDHLLHWFIAGAWLLLAGLTKGIQGMFLLSAPFWCWIILKNGNTKHFLLRTAAIACIPVVFALVAWFTPVIHDSFAAYFGSRFGKTFSGITAHTDNRFHILYELLLDSLPAIGLVCIFLFAARKRPEQILHLRQSARSIFFLLACAFSGILPLMVTLEQRGFYLLTALPLLALAMALTIRPAAEQLAQFVNAKKTVRTGVFAAGTILALGVIVFIVMNAGKFNRDEEKILALREVAEHTGEHIILGVDSTYPDDWSLLSYAQRYHHIALTTAKDNRARWILVPKNAAPPENTTHVPLQSPLFDLYRKQTPRSVEDE